MVALTSIRPFTRADLPAVTALMEERFTAWTHGESFLAQTLLDYPWADPELPSYVAVDEQEEVVGFVGVQVRRLRLDDRPLRGVCSSHLVAATDRPAGLAGAILLREVLSGPQDFTWTDSATDTVLHLWQSMGGVVDYPRCCDWMLVLRPVRWTGAIAKMGVQRRAGGRMRAVASGLMPVGAFPVQAAGPRLVRRGSPHPAPNVDSETATPASIVAQLPITTRDARLWVDHDEPYLDQLLGLIESSTAPVVRRIVRRRGEPIGWYAYLRQPGGVGRVLHVAAPPTHLDAVFGELVEYARANGTSMLAGRADPHLHEPLRRRLAVLGFAGRMLIHTRDPEIRSALATSSSLLTHLDGEWFTT